MKDIILSLILPIYQNSSDLDAVVQDCLLVLPHYVPDYEIILVDDGSTDGTLAAAQHLAATHDPVMVIRHAHHQGYAAALLSGLRSARGDYLVSLSINSRVGVSELARLMPYLNQHDLVVGYRLQRSLAWQQRVREAVVHRLTNCLIGVDMHDISCRVFLMRADIVDPAWLQASNPFIIAEIYARARRQNVPTIQVGLYEQARGTPTRRSSADRLSLRSLRQLLPLWQHLRRPAVSWPVNPQAAHNNQRESFWPQKIVWGLGLAAVARSVWMLVRRLSD